MCAAHPLLSQLHSLVVSFWAQTAYKSCHAGKMLFLSILHKQSSTVIVLDLFHVSVHSWVCVVLVIVTDIKCPCGEMSRGEQDNRDGMKNCTFCNWPDCICFFPISFTTPYSGKVGTVVIPSLYIGTLRRLWGCETWLWSHTASDRARIWTRVG